MALIASEIGASLIAQYRELIVRLRHGGDDIERIEVNPVEYDAIFACVFSKMGMAGNALNGIEWQKHPLEPNGGGAEFVLLLGVPFVLVPSYSPMSMPCKETYSRVYKFSYEAEKEHGYDWCGKHAQDMLNEEFGAYDILSVKREDDFPSETFDLVFQIAKHL